MFSEMRENLQKAFANPNSSLSSKSSKKQKNHDKKSPTFQPVPEEDISVKTKLSKGEKKTLAEKRKRAQKQAETQQAELLDKDYNKGPSQWTPEAEKKMLAHFGHTEGDDTTTNIQNEYRRAIESKLIDPNTMGVMEAAVRLLKFSKGGHTNIIVDTDLIQHRVGR